MGLLHWTKIWTGSIYMEISQSSAKNISKSQPSVEKLMLILFGTQKRPFWNISRKMCQRSPMKFCESIQCWAYLRSFPPYGISVASTRAAEVFTSVIHLTSYGFIIARIWRLENGTGEVGEIPWQPAVFLSGCNERKQFQPISVATFCSLDLATDSRSLTAESINLPCSLSINYAFQTHSEPV